MFDFIEKLQKKPLSYRRNIVIAMSCSITLVIFAVWLSVLLPNMSKNAEVAAVASTDVVTPLDTFKRGLADGFANISAQFGALKARLTTSPATYEAAPAADTSSMQN